MTDFPIDIVIFNKIVEVFNQTRSYVLLLFPLAFFIRIAFGFIFLKTESFTDVLKDSLFLFLGLFFFTDVLKMTLQIPYFVASELSTGDFKIINLADGIFTKALKRIIEWVGIISYWISFGLYIVIVSILGFFAGYILFFGTMFRAYSLIKIFFILLLIVSLWPILWHSINFAVWTIAVSDNAFANNMIVGGASVAKVFIPIWLVSKASKLPVAETLKKVSIAGGGMALAGGAYTSSFLKNNKNFNTENEDKTKTDNEKGNIGFNEMQIETNQADFFKNDEYRSLDDFSIGKNLLEFQDEKPNGSLFETSNEQNIKDNLTKDTLIKQSIKKDSVLENNMTNQVPSQSSVQNNITSKTPNQESNQSPIQNNKALDSSTDFQNVNKKTQAQNHLEKERMNESLNKSILEDLKFQDLYEHSKRKKEENLSFPFIEENNNNKEER